MQNKNQLNDHAPLDSAVFAVLNSSVFGFVFSLSMFNKNYEPHKFIFKKKVWFILRNMLVISTMHGLNQFFIKWFSIEKNKKLIRNILPEIITKNDKNINVFTSFISTTLPAYISCKIYFYKNEYIMLDKKFFFGLAVVFFLFDYYNSVNSNKNNKNL